MTWKASVDFPVEIRFSRGLMLYLQIVSRCYNYMVIKNCFNQAIQMETWPENSWKKISPTITIRPPHILAIFSHMFRFATIFKWIWTERKTSFGYYKSIGRFRDFLLMTWITIDCQSWPHHICRPGFII